MSRSSSAAALIVTTALLTVLTGQCASACGDDTVALIKSIEAGGEAPLFRCGSEFNDMLAAVSRKDWAAALQAYEKHLAGLGKYLRGKPDTEETLAYLRARSTQADASHPEHLLGRAGACISKAAVAVEQNPAFHVSCPPGGLCEIAIADSRNASAIAAVDAIARSLTQCWQAAGLTANREISSPPALNLLVEAYGSAGEGAQDLCRIAHNKPFGRERPTTAFQAACKKR